jgi:hypothetical protein
VIGWVLVVLELLIGALAVGGGVYAVSGAPGWSREWLENTPFRSYLVPGVLLLVLVGGSMFAAAWLLLSSCAAAQMASLLAGVILLGCVAAQFILIGYRHWVQFIFLGLGVAVVVLALLVPG